MECIAVDWSGALTGAASKIWMARATSGVLTSLDAPGSRAGVRDALMARHGNVAPCLVGLDFAFSVPAWFAAARGWREASDVWAAARDDGERWLAQCEAPFWGRPGKPRSHAAIDGLRVTERAWTAVQRPKSVLQIGGAGSVGTGSIRGMPLLLELRTAGWSVWPFDAVGTHTLVEIYPRLFTGPVVKSSETARAAHLASLGSGISSGFEAAMSTSEDAFDAGLSAIGMSRAVSAGATWPAPEPLTAIEGQIWLPGPAACAQSASPNDSATRDDSDRDRR